MVSVSLENDNFFKQEVNLVGWATSSFIFPGNHRYERISAQILAAKISA